MQRKQIPAAVTMSWNTVGRQPKHHAARTEIPKWQLSHLDSFGLVQNMQPEPVLVSGDNICMGTNVFLKVKVVRVFETFGLSFCVGICC